MRFVLFIAIYLLVSPFKHALAESLPYSVFKCVSHEGGGVKGDLNWWFDYSYQGFKWIECRVNTNHIKITSVQINGGSCSIVDNRFIDRDYFSGETVIINHSCMDPIKIELTSDGKTSTIDLK